MVVFTCHDDFESMMTCIYDAWAARLGHSNIKLMTEPVEEPELFCQYRHIDTDLEKCRMVIRSVRTKISPNAFQDIYRASLHWSQDKLDIIYRFLILGFAYGSQVTRMLGNPYVSALFELNRKVTNESHQFREFIRFSRLHDQALFSIIEPKCNILTLAAPHFADRMPSENWLIADKTRMLAVIHPADKDFFLTPISPQELAHMEEARKNDGCADLWKAFFNAVAVEARANYRCQRNFLPLWYRKNMTEFSPHS